MHDDHGPSRAPVHPPGRKDDAQVGDADFNSTSRTVYAAADILKNASKRLLESGAHPALWRLYYAVTGRVEGEHIDGTKRLTLLDEAMRELANQLASYSQYSGDYAQWALTKVEQPAADLRSSLRFQEAQERVDGATLIGGKVLEDTASVDEQAAALHGGIPKLVKDLATVDEWIIRFKHHELHHEAAEMLKGHTGHSRVGTLLELQNVVLAIDGFLTLSDEEFQKELQHNTGLHAWSTRAELVVAAVEIIGAGALVATSLVARIAQLTGNVSIATMASGAARAGGLRLSTALTWIEIGHDAIVILDAIFGAGSRQEAIDAGADASSGLALVVGKSTPAALAIMAGYQELKLVLNTFWSTAVSINAGLMLPALEALQRDGVAIATAADRVAKAGAMAAQEKDQQKAAALHEVLDVDARHLGAALDGLISDCAPTGAEAGVARHPGAYSLIREIFAPVARFKGVKDRERVIDGAKLALTRINFTLSHMGDVIVASTKNQHLTDLERSLRGKEASS
jgi:hypothetical protein